MIAIPEYVKAALKTLKSNGHSAYIVGGAVRDALMGNGPTDYDLASSARPQEVMRLFPHTIPTGIAHGTVTAVFHEGTLEITTFRADSNYSDHRHPDSISFSDSIEEDLARRDFTVNAIAFDGEHFVDPYGGREDIELKVIRAIGEPERRFSEDALRILRCFRFASQLGFKIEERTKEAALRLSDSLPLVSIERITAELLKLLCGCSPQFSSPLFCCGALEFSGLASKPVPEALSLLPKESELRLAALCLLHGTEPKKLGLRLSNSEKASVSAIYELLKGGCSANRPELKRRLRLYSERDTLLAAQGSALLSGKDPKAAAEAVATVACSDEPYKISMLNIDGKALSDIGFRGRAIGNALEALLDRCIDEPSLNTRERLLAEAKKLYESGI